MRHGAKQSGKVVPSYELLDNLTDRLVAGGMVCPCCRRPMNWLFKDGAATVVSLQHDRDGTLRLICKGCNSRHAQHPGDSFYDIPEGHKLCRSCGQVKAVAEFYSLRGSGKPSARCKPCERSASLAGYRKNRERCIARNRAWKEANRDKVKAQRQREYAARKEARRARV